MNITPDHTWRSQLAQGFSAINLVISGKLDYGGGKGAGVMLCKWRIDEVPWGPLGYSFTRWSIWSVQFFITYQAGYVSE